MNKKRERKMKLEKEKIRLMMLMIRTRWRYHKFLYYEMATPIISDNKFDMLEKKFKKICDYIERVYPAMFEIYKPSVDEVGYDWGKRGA